MADFIELLTPARIVWRESFASKKRCLQRLAELLAADEAAEEGPSARHIFDQLCERERLGSTGLGKGIAIPHARVDALAAPRAALLTTPEGIDFDAVDGAPVDLLVALLVPAQADQHHLQLLADIAAHLDDQSFCQRVREASSVASLRDQLLADRTPDRALAPE